jgi:hypothetical protein
MPAGTSTTLSLSIKANAALDLGYGTLTVNYGTGPDPISTIRGYIVSGYNAGAWNGVGIMSSSAGANSSSYGLGYADAADVGNPAGLATGTIKIAYTLLGDANLDGVVNAVDFGILAANFNKGVNGWDQGDFNYDGVVNAVDFGDLAANFNKGAIIPASTDETSTVAAAPVVTGADSQVLSASPSSNDSHAYHSSSRRHRK